MKPIFNSLGSNYDLSYALKALRTIFFPDPQAATKLNIKLSEMYQGSTILTYKGRDAIELALKQLIIGKNDQIITQAFTCHAIEEAIIRTGARPVFVDLEINELNPSVDTLQEALDRSQSAKAVIIQNTLGYPADMVHIASWCKKNNLMLIEDLAQSVEASVSERVKVGKYGDAIIHSFGRDKVIDGVSGGACIIRQQNIDQQLESLPFSIVLKDMLYPLFTWFIRTTHNLIIGKIFQRILVSVKLIQNPILSPTTSVKQIALSHAELALVQLNKLDKQLKHRRKIASIYQKQLEPNLIFTTNPQVQSAVNLRFPILIDSPAQLAIHLKKHNIHISDRWYRAPVDYGKLNKNTTYKPGTCPNAERMAKHIFNLPTHQQITSSDAERIAKLINEYTS